MTIYTRRRAMRHLIAGIAVRIASAPWGYIGMVAVAVASAAIGSRA